VNPFAYFDCLAMTSRLQPILGNVAVGEVHLFAYLSCLLSLYRSRPIAEWDYKFAGTREGSPFSSDVEAALGALIRGGLLLEKDDFLQISERGQDEFELLESLEINRIRLQFLDGACNSVLALPVGIIRDAVANDPGIRPAKVLSATRPLLDESSTDEFYVAFAALSKAVGVDITDLMIPAVIWVRYLAEHAAATDTAVVTEGI
jgi:hypothetical protein